MKKLPLLGTFIFCCLLISTAVRAAEGLSQITEHVYSYLDVKEASPANSFGANAGIIIGEQGIMVVDTLVSAKEAARFLSDIRIVTDKPIKYIINTHFHLDHTFGNSQLADTGALFIAHADCDAEMHLKAENILAAAAGFGLSKEAMEGTTIKYPQLTFSNAIQIDLGNLKVKLIQAAPSHTKGSIIAYIPAEQVAFAGDILFTDFHPYMADSDVNGWKQALDTLNGLKIERIIPGHGPLSTERDVIALQEYLTIFDKTAKELTNTDLTIDQIVTELQKNLPTKSQGEWMIKANVQAKYMVKEKSGEYK